MIRIKKDGGAEIVLNKFRLVLKKSTRSEKSLANMHISNSVV